MYKASEMRQIAEDAKIKKAILKKCAAQQYVARNYDKIENAAINGKFSTIINIPREYGFAFREILRIFQNFGYEWKILKQNCLTMEVEIFW